MKKNSLRRLSMLLSLSVMFATILSGCGDSGEGSGDNQPPASVPTSSEASNLDDVGTNNSSDITLDDADTNNSSDSVLDDSVSATELYVTFGDDGSPFTMHLYDNDTATAIAKHVGTADWRLPIYNYEGYDNWEVMQFYDIPDRYEIPSNPQSVTSETSGAVYYSEPNRIVLFFGDAEVAGEYTQIGYFDATDEFVNAVRDNPVLEGWGNKIIKISADN